MNKTRTFSNEHPGTDAAMLVEASDIPDPYANTLSSEQAGAILGFSAQKARRLAKEGKLSARKVTDKRGEAWRFDRVGPLAPTSPKEDPMALAGATFPHMTVANYGELFQLVRDLRTRNDELHQEVVRLRETAAADRARAEVALSLLGAPPEAPKKRPWWKLWTRVE